LTLGFLLLPAHHVYKLGQTLEVMPV